MNLFSNSSNPPIVVPLLLDHIRLVLLNGKELPVSKTNVLSNNNASPKYAECSDL